jgi:hypothetical protein
MLLLASRNFPSRLTADYGSFNPGLANEAAIIDRTQFYRVALTPASAGDVREWVRGLKGAQHI